MTLNRKGVTMPEDKMFNKDNPNPADPKTQPTQTPEGQPPTDKKPDDPNATPVDAKTPLNKIPRFQEIVKEKNELSKRIEELEDMVETIKGSQQPPPQQDTGGKGKPWHEPGSDQKPPDWPGVYQKIKEDAKKEMYVELGDAIKAEREKTLTEDTTLDNDVKALKDNGDIDDKSEEALLELHQRIYGNVPYQKGAINKTLELFKEIQKGKTEGTKEGQKLGLMKQVAGKSSVGSGEFKPAARAPGSYQRDKTKSMQDVAQEFAQNFLRK